MAKDIKKANKRVLKGLTSDIFADQFDTMQDITEQTGKNRAQLVREAIDLAYPRKKKDA